MLEERCSICGKENVELAYISKRQDLGKICLSCFQIFEQKGGENTMGELSDYVKRNSKTFTLQDGESAEVVYQGFKIGANKYDPEKEAVYYQFETEYGIKTFQSSALGLAKLFDAIEKGTPIKITRQGEGNKTKYLLERKIEGHWVDATMEGPFDDEE